MPTPDDSRDIVRAVALPYRVPVDFIVRTFLFVCLGTVLLVAHTSLRAPESTPVILWALYVFAFCYLGFLNLRPSGLTIDGQGIHHVSWLRKRRDVPWDSIESVTTGTQDFAFHGAQIAGTLGKVDGAQGLYLMIIGRRDGQPSFIINIKLYTMSGLITLSHFLIAHASHARLDERTVKLTKGIVPSVFFGEQKGRG